MFDKPTNSQDLFNKTNYRIYKFYLGSSLNPSNFLIYPINSFFNL